VSNGFLKENRSLVADFTEGMLEGLRFSLLNPQETVERFLKEHEVIAMKKDAARFTELGLGIGAAVTVAPEPEANGLGFTDLAALDEQANLVRAAQGGGARSRSAAGGGIRHQRADRPGRPVAGRMAAAPALCRTLRGLSRTPAVGGFPALGLHRLWRAVCLIGGALPMRGRQAFVGGWHEHDPSAREFEPSGHRRPDDAGQRRGDGAVRPGEQLYDAAKKESEFTWYTAHYDQALATRIGNAFTQKYPGVQANVIKATAQVTYQRLLQDIKAGQIQSDVFSSTDVSHFVQLKQNGNLEKFVPENQAKIVEAFRNADPDGFYTLTWVGLVAVSYNTTKVKATDAPKSWTELLDPKWTGQIASGNPNFSGSVGVWTVALNKLYGWDLVHQAERVEAAARTLDR